MKVTFHKETYLVDEDRLTSVIDLKHYLVTLFDDTYRASEIKLIYSGKVLKDDESLHELGIPSDKSISMIAAREEDVLSTTLPRHLQTRVINDLTIDGKVIEQDNRHNNTCNNRSKYDDNVYKFHNVEVLPQFVDSQKAMDILTTLANDVGFLAVMKKHKWSVGSLTEMYPDGMVGVDDVCVMGLNKNKGQQILLRIRTDDLQGFRKIASIRNVLCHELAHNVHSDHDDDFYRLMRIVQKEVVELDWRKGKSSTLSSDSYGYTSYGNNSGSNGSNSADTSIKTYRLAPEDTLQQQQHSAAELAGQSAIRRSQQEIDMELQCGCTYNRDSGKVTQPVLVDISADMCLPCEPQSVVVLDTVIDIPTVESSSMLEIPTSIASTSKPVTTEIYTEIMSIVDDAIAISLESSSVVLERLFSLREGIHTMLTYENPRASSLNDVLDTFTLLRLFIGNAKTLGPMDSKYYTINTRSSKFKTLITRVPGAVPVLLAAGFDNEAALNGGYAMTLGRKDQALLYITYSIVDSCLDILCKYK